MQHSHALRWLGEFSLCQHLAFSVRQLESHLRCQQVSGGPLAHGGVEWFGGEFRGPSPLVRIRRGCLCLRRPGGAELRVAAGLYALAGDPLCARQELQQVEQAQRTVPCGAVVGVVGARFVVAQVEDGEQACGVWRVHGGDGEG